MIRISFEVDLLGYCQRSYWTIEEASILLWGGNPAKFLMDGAIHEGEHPHDEGMEIDSTIAFYKLEEAITLAAERKDIESEILTDANGNSQIVVRSLSVYKYAMKNGIEVPPILNRHFDSLRYIDHKLRPSQIAKHKCIALASYFWSLNPDITIQEMSEKEEIFIHGADERYRESIYGWIRALAPNPRPGKRPKRK